jgi:hypothetical protein
MHAGEGPTCTCSGIGHSSAMIPCSFTALLVLRPSWDGGLVFLEVCCPASTTYQQM